MKWNRIGDEVDWVIHTYSIGACGDLVRDSLGGSLPYEEPVSLWDLKSRILRLRVSGLGG